jgi:hypothetical protein
MLVFLLFAVSILGYTYIDSYQQKLIGYIIIVGIILMTFLQIGYNTFLMVS